MTKRGRTGVKCRRFLSLTLTALFLVGAAPPPIWGDLQPGKHAVGVEAVPLQSSGATVRAVIWRPVRGASRNLTVAELVKLICGNDSTASAACLADARDQLRSGGEAAVDAKLQELMRAPVYSRAAPAGAAGRERFPVIILEGANATRGGDFMVLAEYLASWGYVVVSVGDAPLTAPPYSTARAQQKVQAVKEALSLLSSRTYADIERLGAVTWSFGGVVIPIAAHDDRRFRAQASLDSAFNYAYGGAILREALPSAFAPGRCTPLLHLLPGVENSVAKDDGYANASGLTYRAVVPGFAHGSFSDLRGVMVSFANGGENWKNFVPTYGSAARALRKFLDAYVKDDGSALAELEKSSIGGEALSLSLSERCRSS